ncbi:Neurochondrin-domain-containing protein [Podospora didyma]|uniref:Neurochondrin-domain-containing protein n=1 Tax=Podospora didyma TaxID=330526 RepID=A0AAE0KFZ5_9PEZI|nr:Neurochondrin-domain-containing protein [Podospora didyma]
MDAAPSSASEQATSVRKIKTLLGSSDDTSRFVGLALLKSVLDNSPELRQDEETIVALWQSIPPKFLERLIRTGSQPSRKDGRDMLDLAVSVLHTFAALLPDSARADGRITDRIPQLVACLLYCSDDNTTRLVLETLMNLVSQPEGACVFAAVEDLAPLIEMAPSQPLVLDTLSLACLSSMTATLDRASLRSRIDNSISQLVSSFKGTDAVTLLAFLANLLPQLEREVLPQDPSWLAPVVNFTRALVVSRPAPAARAAYANASAALLEVYPEKAPPLLFHDDGKTEKPFSYLLIHLLLIDLRASLPTLLGQPYSDQYIETTKRLTSAFNVVSNFIGYLLRSMEDESAPLVVPPEFVLKLRTSTSETMSLSSEYLRDRWDAAVAGAMSLHPEARAATANAETGSRLTLAWDSMGETVSEDPLILAAIQTLAIWLREDDGELLRREAAGLADMFVELYRESSGNNSLITSSSSSSTPVEKRKLDFRRAVLVAFEGITLEESGIDAFLNNGGWSALTEDLAFILQFTSVSPSPQNEAASRGIEIIRVLLHVAEAEGHTREEWMDIVTKAAAVYVPDSDDNVQMAAGTRQLSAVVVDEFQAAALQLVTSLLVNTHPAMQKRYIHSTTAILGIARQLRSKVPSHESGLAESLDDVVHALAKLR